MDTIETLAPIFDVNLDDPPHLRWNQLVTSRENEVIILAKEIPNAIKEQFGVVASWLHKPLIRPLCWMKSIPHVYSQELVGITRSMNRILIKHKMNCITYSDLVLFNVAVDFMARCTSMVVSTTNGQMHGRTLDWDWPILKQLTCMVRFRRGGAVVYQGITFLGCVGLLTAMKPYAFSASYNFRKTHLGQDISLCHLRKCYFSGNHLSFVIRDAVSVCETYHQVVKRLEKIPVAASGYITICGKKVYEGTIITKGINGYTRNCCPRRNLRWNHDENMIAVDPKWAGDDPVLQSTLEREKQACAAFESMRTISKGYVEKVMETSPIQNATTIFTCFMIPGANVMNCVVDVYTR